MVDIDSDPRIVGNHVFIATYQGRVASVALDSGSIEWVRDMSSYAGIDVDADHIYLTDDHSKVWSLDQNDGSVMWTQDKLQGRSLSGRFAARRETRLFTSSNGCKYGRCTMTKKACSNGSAIAAAVSRM